MDRPKIPAAQYLRMSTEHQRYSLSNQAETVRAFAQENGFEVVRSYEDAGRSGLTTKHREGLKALLSDVMSGAPFSNILVVDVSRWGRFQDPDEAGHYEFICRQAGVNVIYCAESFADDPSGAIMKQLKRVMAGEYSRDLSRKVRQGQRRAALAGNLPGSQAPFGFRRAAHERDGTLVKVLEPGERKPRRDHVVKLIWGPPHEIETLRLIFRLYVHEHFTPAMIAAHLNEMGRAGCQGRRWRGHGISRVLANEIAAGVMVFNRSGCHLGQRTGLFPPAQWIKRPVCAPVVSPSVFQMAQDRRTELDGRTRTDKQLLDLLRKLLKKTGRLSMRDIDLAPGMPTGFAYWRRFGSLKEAYRLIGYDDRGRPDARLTTKKREEIIRGLRRVHRRHGGINATLINEDAQLPSARSIVARFGPLNVLYRDAGLSVCTKGWQRRRGWSEHKSGSKAS